MKQVWKAIEHFLCRIYCLLGCHLDIDASEDSQKHLSYYIYCKHCNWKKLRYYTGEKEKLEAKFKEQLDKAIELTTNLI